MDERGYIDVLRASTSSIYGVLVLLYAYAFVAQVIVIKDALLLTGVVVGLGLIAFAAYAIAFSNYGIASASAGLGMAIYGGIATYLASGDGFQISDAYYVLILALGVILIVGAVLKEKFSVFSLVAGAIYFSIFIPCLVAELQTGASIYDAFLKTFLVLTTDPVLRAVGGPLIPIAAVGIIAGSILYLLRKDFRFIRLSFGSSALVGLVSSLALAGYAYRSASILLYLELVGSPIILVLPLVFALLALAEIPLAAAAIALLRFEVPEKPVEEIVPKKEERPKPPPKPEEKEKAKKEEEISLEELLGPPTKKEEEELPSLEEIPELPEIEEIEF